MKITAIQLGAIAGGTMTASRTANVASIIAGLDAMGEKAGLDRPHRLAHYIAQIAHESGRFVYDKEVWGPTPAQKRYEGRKDLGNTEPGDGRLFSGHGPIQITGRANTTAFRDWCWAQGLKAPDFAETPNLINTDPWEGIGPIWYWATRNLNRYADDNNIEMVTRRINGGTNGFDDRVDLYIRTALVFLGIKLDRGAVKRFQEASGLIADDIAGPATRAAMHKALVALKPGAVAAPAQVEIIASAPVQQRPQDTSEPPAELPRPREPAPPVLSVPEADWQPQLTVPEYLAIIETSTAAIRKLTAGA